MKPEVRKGRATKWRGSTKWPARQLRCLRPRSARPPAGQAPLSCPAAAARSARSCPAGASPLRRRRPSAIAGVSPLPPQRPPQFSKTITSVDESTKILVNTLVPSITERRDAMLNGQVATSSQRLDPKGHFGVVAMCQALGQGYDAHLRLAPSNSGRALQTLHAASSVRACLGRLPPLPLCPGGGGGVHRWYACKLLSPSRS